MITKRWVKADSNMDGKLDAKEIGKLCNTLNLNMEPKTLKTKFDKFDKDKSGTLEYTEFVEFYKSLMTRFELASIFAKYSTKGVMTPKQWQLFCISEQGEASTGSSPSNFYEFTRELFSLENLAYRPEAKTLYQDMTKPIVEYYMNSSHNTYLSGNQLTGTSSVEMYSRALEMGCRCVEIDCWDGQDGEPIVTHGHTLTSKIRFLDVIKTIKESAFVVSPYPVVLSLEVHTSVLQQDRMADIMKEVLGDAIFGTLSDSSWHSPESLKNKFILKNKKLKRDQDEVDDEDLLDDDEDEMDVNSESKVDIMKTAPSPKKMKPLSRKLSDMTTLDSQKWKSWADKQDIHQMCSFSEKKLGKFLKREPHEVEKYATRQFVRVYPKGTRINSSNLNPIEAWSAGCQIVALNFQTMDQPMRINQLKFVENGGAGYILKPKNSGKSFTLNIEVISGEQIPRPKNGDMRDIVDPFVTISLFGPVSETVKSRVVTDEGFHPLFGDKFSLKGNSIELSSIYIALYDKNTVTKDEFIGDVLIPLAHLRKGYRSIEFHGIDLKPIEFARLFCHFIIE